jgi:glycosyltransferase involved in cell wall biosynthesis
MYPILITAPSLDEQNNVSGISTVVRNIMQFSDKTIKYFHFKVGKQDKKNRSVSWFFDQVFLIPNFINSVIKWDIKAVHLNTGFERASLSRDFIIFFVAKYILHKKIIFHVHGGYYLMNPPGENTFFNYIIRTLLQKSDVVIVLSEIEKAVLQKRYTFNNCFALPNAVAQINVEGLEKDFSGQLSFCFLGRIVKSKGIFVIIDALKSLRDRFNDFSFHLYGTGPELTPVLSQLNSIQGLNFTYHGVVGGQKKWEVLEESHIFLLPSLYGEGLPMAILEAMNVKCVPVVTNDASISAVVQDGYNGFIVEKGNADELASTLRHIIDHREILAPLSNVAHETIEKKFTLEHYVADLYNIYAVSILY